MSAATAQSNTGSDLILRAVIIYDDFDSATRAAALLERVAVHADEGLKWDIKPWRSEVLKQTALAALTCAVAANADLMVLALRQARSMPAGLLAWLTDWARQRRIPDAAVLAMPPDDDVLAERWGELKTFTKRHGLIYLERNSAVAEHNPAAFGRRWQRQLAALESPRVFAGRLPLPSHWGINE